MIEVFYTHPSEVERHSEKLCLCKDNKITCFFTLAKLKHLTKKPEKRFLEFVFGLNLLRIDKTIKVCSFEDKMLDIPNKRFVFDYILKKISNEHPELFL